MIPATHYRDALAVQDACNLSGVVHAFARAMQALAAEGLDTDARNRHPIAVLYASKIASLADSESFTRYANAYEIARAYVDGSTSAPVSVPVSAPASTDSHPTAR